MPMDAITHALLAVVAADDGDTPAAQATSPTPSATHGTQRAATARSSRSRLWSQRETVRELLG
jgi:hypothetical protein